MLLHVPGFKGTLEVSSSVPAFLVPASWPLGLCPLAVMGQPPPTRGIPVKVLPCIYVCVCAQSCLALYGPMDCSLPGFCVRGILQEKYLNGLPFPIPGDLPDPGMEPIPLLFPE